MQPQINGDLKDGTDDETMDVADAEQAIISNGFKGYESKNIEEMKQESSWHWFATKK